MKGSVKIVKGRIEEAAGALVGNDKLRAKGQTDQAVGHIIQAGEKGIRQANKSARKIVEKARDSAQAAVEHAKKTK
jgi:uncharacterized protein YjbJ (UPF0337 family)